MLSVEQLFLLLTVSVAGLGVIGILLVKTTLQGISENLAQVRLRGRDAARHPAIKVIIREYEQALRQHRARADAGVLVERVLQAVRPLGLPVRVGGWTGFVRAGISACVVLGLLGTFVGLAIALSGLSGSLEQAAAQAGETSDLVALLTQLRLLMGGMSTAFRASIFGVSGSLLLTLLSALAGTFRALPQLATDLEHYLLNDYESDEPEQDQDGLARVADRLDGLVNTVQTGLVDTLARGTAQLGDALRQATELMGQVGAITGGLNSSARSLQRVSEAIEPVARDLREVLAAIQAGQAAMAARLEALTNVERTLADDVQALQRNLELDSEYSARMVAAADALQSGARQFESVVAQFRAEWPGMMRDFVGQTGQAVEQQVLEISAVLEGLREVMEQSQKDNLAYLEEFVSSHQATVQAVADSLLPSRGGSTRG